MEPKPGIYEHYKGKQYEVLGIAKHEETHEDLVIYKPLYKPTITDLWARPRTVFLSQVEVNGTMVPRFRYIGPT